MTAQDQDTFLQVGEYRVLLVPSRGERMFYAFARTLVDGINHLYFGVKVEGREKIPSPPYILAPTHRSNIDTLLMGSVVRRRLRFMGKDGLWRRRFFGKVLGALGGIPVNRETADRGAVATSVAVLGAGQSLVLFPEGTRKEGPVIQDILDGAAYIALKAQVPIIPVGIGGSDRAMAKGVVIPRPAHCHIIIGDPILGGVQRSASSTKIPRSQIRELTVTLQSRLQELYDQARDA